jgi:hypothetical protein
MLFAPHNNINIILYNSNTEGQINDFQNNNIEWNKIKELILKYYEFNIKSRLNNDL